MSNVSKLRKKLKGLSARLPSESGRVITKELKVEVEVTYEKGKRRKRTGRNNSDASNCGVPAVPASSPDSVRKTRTKGGHKKPHELWREAIDATFNDGAPLNVHMTPYREKLYKVKFEKDGEMVQNDAAYNARHSFPSIYRKYRAAWLNQKFAEEQRMEKKEGNRKKKKCSS